MPQDRLTIDQTTDAHMLLAGKAIQGIGEVSITAVEAAANEKFEERDCVAVCGMLGTSQ